MNKTASPAEQQARRVAETVWRMESPRLIAALVRMLRDLDLAEDLAQDALLAALEQWPKQGVPDNPGAWLMTIAKHRAIDRLRRHKLLERKHVELGYELDQRQEEIEQMRDEALDDSIGDDLLRLIFTACHPVLSAEARAALTLRLLGGLSTEEIARAFLVPEPTMAQRIVRAKRTLGEAEVAFELPRGEAFAERLGSVLQVIYLIFNEGYTATTGDDWMRPSLCEEAMRLGRVLIGLVPQEPEAYGLVALMELQASRLPARSGADGAPILLREQDRRRWNRLLIQRGLAALSNAERLQGIDGIYALQAAIAACHARAQQVEQTDWARIAALYQRLAERTGSPVVELNRAVAVSMAQGPAVALPLVEALRDEGVLAGYHLLPSVHGDLLARLDRHVEARAEFLRAAELTRNERERQLLLQRAAACADLG